MRRSRSIPLVLAVAVLLGGCADSPEPSDVMFPVPVQPQPAAGVAVACMDALTSGTLVADARWGIALGQTNGPTIQVLWPTGFVGRQVDGAIELLDHRGIAVARVGDKVQIAGGQGAGNAWWACGAPTSSP